MQTVKRLSDLLIVSISLIILSPLLFVLAILVRIFLRNPILLRQRRPGLHGKPFTIYKFRTMTDARDAQDNLLPDAERLTPFGRFLHSPSLDERILTWKLVTWPMKSSCPPEALAYLAALTARQRRIVLNAIETRLSISQPPQQGGVSLCDLTRWLLGVAGWSVPCILPGGVH